MNVALSVTPDETYRLRREQLDGCLEAVEAALERGESVVTTPIAFRLSQYVASIEGGVPLVAALERVFEAQRDLFGDHSASGQVRGWPEPLRQESRAQRRLTSKEVDAPERRLTKSEAEALTNRIKDHLHELPQLLLEAHNGRAWIPLGFHSWELYVRFEFGLSRSRSYELLDQARVVRALKAAAGDRPVPPISCLAAMRIKPHLDEVVAHVHARLSNGEAELPNGDIRRIIDETGGRVVPANLHRHTPRGGQITATVDVSPQSASASTTTFSQGRLLAVVEAIDVLAEQPPAADVVWGLSADDTELLIHLPAAARWVGELLDAWSIRCPIDVHPSAEADLSVAATGTDTVGFSESRIDRGTGS